MAKVTVSRDPACLTQRAFHLLRSTAIATFGIARSQIKLHADLNDVFPFEGRPASWAKFRHNVGAVE